MSDNNPGTEFWNRVNAIINLANDQSESADPGEVGASILFASTRFNAFLVARSTGNAQNMKLEKERAMEYYVDQFRKMMSDNLDDFAENFDKYMAPPSR